jgi:formate transporter
MPIALFVATGFEHSVANMFMIPLGILMSDTAGAGFWGDAKIDASSYCGLIWDSFFVDNLLSVTLGNIVGGGVMIGVMYWTIFHHTERPVSPVDS